MLKFYISRKGTIEKIDHWDGPIEFGRAASGNSGARRHVIDQPGISDNHLRVESTNLSTIVISNLSPEHSIRFADNTLLLPGEEKQCKLPVARISLGRVLIDIESAAPNRESVASLSRIAPARRSRDKPRSTALSELGPTPSPEALIQWFETVIEVQESVPGSASYFNRIAEAVVELVGLDYGLVLLRNAQGEWDVVGGNPPSGSQVPVFSKTLLAEIVRDRQTLFELKPSRKAVGSLQGVQAVVAAPILMDDRSVRGAVYGVRIDQTNTRALGVSRLEAFAVQLLSSAVGNGLSRMEHEAEANRQRTQFEQFFSKRLAGALQEKPNLLDGQEREISVLFADIRGYSAISEQLRAKRTCEFTSAVMDEMTQAIHSVDGVVVDYAGDGLMAMWNAPHDQSDHATRACTAATDILNRLPKLNQQWGAELSVPIRVGLGINTGTVLAGNIGCRQRFKYGPMGHAVNLASRVEGATKRFGVPLLITESTKRLVGDRFATKRIRNVHVVGINQQVSLYEVHTGDVLEDWLKRKTIYESALQHFEAAEFTKACKLLNSLLADEANQNDRTILDLLAASVHHLQNPHDPFDSTMRLHSK